MLAFRTGVIFPHFSGEPSKREANEEHQTRDTPGAPRSLRACLRCVEKCRNITPVLKARECQPLET